MVGTSARIGDDDVDGQHHPLDDHDQSWRVLVLDDARRNSTTPAMPARPASVNTPRQMSGSSGATRDRSDIIPGSRKWSETA